MNIGGSHNGPDRKTVAELVCDVCGAHVADVLEPVVIMIEGQTGCPEHGNHISNFTFYHLPVPGMMSDIFHQ
jgi:hypothetical protein